MVNDIRMIPLDEKDLNTGIQKVKIAVFGIGKGVGGDNRAIPDEKAAINLAKTLRGAPIVGEFLEYKEDFGNHGGKIIITTDEVKFEKTTKPYGFVPMEADVWFENIKGTDYVCTEGCVWKGQYKELDDLVYSPQSMELFEDSIKTENSWANIGSNLGRFCLINDANIKSLCILGSDQQPCFPEAGIMAKFGKNTTNFIHELVELAKKMNFTEEGSREMEGENNLGLGQPQGEDVNNEPQQATPDEGAKTEDNNNTQEPQGEANPANTEESNEPTKTEETPKQEPQSEPIKVDEGSKSNEDVNKQEDKQEEDKASVLTATIEELQGKFTTVSEENVKLKEQIAEMSKTIDSLNEFKSKVDKEAKLELISEFTMLSDEEKKDVVDNIDKFSLEEIKNKLSVACFNKGCFSKNEEKNNFTANLVNIENNDTNNDNDLPEWVKAVVKRM